MTLAHRKFSARHSLLARSSQLTREHPYLAGLVAAVAASVVSSLVNRHLAKKAEPTFHRVPNNGHMVHQTAISALMSAVDEIVRAASTAPAGNPKNTPKHGPVLLR